MCLYVNANDNAERLNEIEKANQNTHQNDIVPRPTVQTVDLTRLTIFFHSLYLHYFNILFMVVLGTQKIGRFIRFI